MLVKRKKMSQSLPHTFSGDMETYYRNCNREGRYGSDRYTQNISFIKIINETHFAFLQHDINKGKGPDSIFASGGGNYSLSDSVYTEHLTYCSARNWEGNDFIFTVNIKNDTLIQSGIEKVESEGISRLNIEKYIRVKK